MKVNEITIRNFDWTNETLLSFEVLPTDELICIVNSIREKDGNKDLVGDNDNDVWYNFYLDVDIKRETLDLWASCNNGEKDDYAQYGIGLSEDEEKMLVWKAFRQYSEEVEELN